MPMIISSNGYLVFSQQFALPEGVGDIMNGQAEIVGASLEMQILWFFQQLTTHLPFQLQHFLRVSKKGEM